MIKNKLDYLTKCLIRYTVVILFVCTFANLYSNEAETLNTLRRNFVSADIDEKLTILKSLPNSADINLIPLYKDVINYFQNSYTILHDDIRLLDIGIIAVKHIGELNEKSALQDIRYLFSAVENEDFKIACLKTLSVLIEKDSGFITYLNSRYDSGLSDLLAGKKLNINLLISYAEALGNFADTSSFDILFKTLLYPVSENLKKAVTNALHNISFDFFYEIVGKKDEKNIQYIWTLYVLAKENKNVSSGKLGEITESVLAYGLQHLKTDPENAEKLVLETLKTLSNLKWSKASADVNKFFFFEQTAWKQSKISSDVFIQVIDCMGHLGTPESSRNLSIFLGVLNSETEKTKQYDENLILAVITALGRLGDKTAFDYLLYVEYLDYSETVKQASRNAIEELKW